MTNGFTVYKIYQDGSGEKIAWFQYPGSCAKFVGACKITDFFSPVSNDDKLIILTIEDSTREIRYDLTTDLLGEDK